MEKRVAIVPCPDYAPENIKRALNSAIEASGGLGWVRPGMRVAVKTNLVSRMKPESAAVTHPALVAERQPAPPGHPGVPGGLRDVWSRALTPYHIRRSCSNFLHKSRPAG